MTMIENTLSTPSPELPDVAAIIDYHVGAAMISPDADRHANNNTARRDRLALAERILANRPSVRKVSYGYAMR